MKYHNLMHFLQSWNCVWIDEVHTSRKSKTYFTNLLEIGAKKQSVTMILSALLYARKWNVNKLANNVF
jgi:hypothetical protein